MFNLYAALVGGWLPFPDVLVVSSGRVSLKRVSWLGTGAIPQVLRINFNYVIA